MPPKSVHTSLVMAIALLSTATVRHLTVPTKALLFPARTWQCTHRYASQATAVTTQKLTPNDQTAKQNTPPALARLSTVHLARSIILGRLLAHPRFFQLSLSILRRVANPQSILLNPDRNGLVKAIVRFCIYDQFCAGENAHEVSQTVSSIKSSGYSGVILCPSREITVDFSVNSSGADVGEVDSRCRQIEDWKESHLTTLSMLGENDYMGMKFTGAGQAVFDRLAEGGDPPTQLLAAMDVICNQAASQKSRIWIDAEEQKVQPTIDRWALDLMRKYNVRGTALVSNTYQAYLKKTPAVLEAHLRLAQEEGWALGIKLVRGAYIGSETRLLIHNTKSDTDQCYDRIAAGIIRKTFPGFINSPTAAGVFLVLAGHNTESIRKASMVYEEAIRSGGSYTPTMWAQLQGMADEVGCDLLHQAELSSTTGPSGRRQIYKCLQWGSVGDCLQFLIRRATENNHAAGRIAGSSQRMMDEMHRRLKGMLQFR